MRRIAFVLGSNGPERLGKLKRLEHAVTDAEKFVKVISRGHAKFSSEMPTHRDAQSIRAELSSLVNSLTPHDSFLFYFSGHGLLSRGNLYFVLDETVKDALLPNTSLPWSIVKEIIRHSESVNNVVVLDCCHAGAAVESLFGETYKGGFNSEAVANTLQGSTASVLYACGPDSLARETQTRGGVMTSLLVDGLGRRSKEAADPSGRVSLVTLRDWMWREIDSKDDLKHLRFDERPRLYTSGGPTFFLIEDCTAEIMPAVDEHVGNAQRNKPVETSVGESAEATFTEPIDTSSNHSDDSGKRIDNGRAAGQSGRKRHFLGLLASGCISIFISGIVLYHYFFSEKALAEAHQKALADAKSSWPTIKARAEPSEIKVFLDSDIGKEAVSKEELTNTMASAVKEKEEHLEEQFCELFGSMVNGAYNTYHSIPVNMEEWPYGEYRKADQLPFKPECGQFGSVFACRWRGFYSLYENATGNQPNTKAAYATESDLMGKIVEACSDKNYACRSTGIRYEIDRTIRNFSCDNGKTEIELTADGYNNDDMQNITARALGPMR